MIRTPVCDVLHIEHPIAIGGMGSVYSPPLAAAVSNAGGLGAMGCHYMSAEQVRAGTAAIREQTNKPFALNFLIFDVREEGFAAALALRPSVMAFAWPRPDQDVKAYIDRAHDAGCKITFMTPNVPDAVRAAEAGADVIVAQGTEGGGHVGWQTTMTLVPMVVDAVAPVPVLAAGGIADGRGLAATLALGAQGVCSARAFSPPRNRRCTRISSRRSSIATATTRCCRRFPILPPASCGRARCRARGAMASSNAGPAANGRCASAKPKRWPRSRRRVRAVTPTRRRYRWARTPASFTTLRRLPRSSAASPARRRRF